MCRMCRTTPLMLVMAHSGVRYTVNQIAAEFGVTRPTIYRHLKSSGGS